MQASERNEGNGGEWCERRVEEGPREGKGRSKVKENERGMESACEGVGTRNK